MAGIICERCGQSSPTQFMADINHFPMHGTDVCTSQWLALNQLSFAVRHSTDLLALLEKQERVRELRCERQARERGLI